MAILTVVVAIMGRVTTRRAQLSCGPLIVVAGTGANVVATAAGVATVVAMAATVAAAAASSSLAASGSIASSFFLIPGQ